MMEKLDLVLQELGISKVRLAKYLGVSRQMVYNYLEMDDLNLWPKEKKIKLFQLLNIKSTDEIKKIKVTSDYIMEVEGKLNQGVKTTSNIEDANDLKALNKRDQELLTDIIHLLKERLLEDKTKDTANVVKYLYHFLQSIGTSKELKYMLAYVSKSTGFTNPVEFVFNEDQQFIFESILYSAMTLYNGGGASKTKIAESHKRFVQEIEHRNEEKLSRTQELNSAKVQALKELGYTEINEDNAREVLEKIAEIQSRKV
jgi:transcriptional regulator with XRE-family HTH domain